MPLDGGYRKSKAHEVFMGMNAHNNAYFGQYNPASKSKSRERKNSMGISVESND